jgi:hypothetical protein
VRGADDASVLERGRDPARCPRFAHAGTGTVPAGRESCSYHFEASPSGFNVRLSGPLADWRLLAWRLLHRE